jgi:hypothetical protein
MDFVGAKGVGLARVAAPVGLVDVFVTHLHANYARASPRVGGA